jgi:hypothetical protein
LRRPAVERRLGGDGVLLDLVGRAMYLLNPTALARRYRVPEATAAPGCLAALAFLEAADLLVGAEG